MLSTRCIKLLDQSKWWCLANGIFSQGIIINATSRLYSTSKDLKQDETVKTQTAEIAHHARSANNWWDAQYGPLIGLHSFNEIRVPFIRDGLMAQSGGIKMPDNINTSEVLKNQKILEVGCGGGVLTESLARLGATVTAIDLGHDLIQVAREHLENESRDLLKNVTYKVIPIEAHAKEHFNYYDAVVLSEVIEHVYDKVSFLNDCVQCLKPGCSLYITTFNKTIRMWIYAIAILEYVLNYIPKGTHHWNLLISPSNLIQMLDTLGCETVLLKGSIWNPYNNKWSWINSEKFAYALQATKIVT